MQCKFYGYQANAAFHVIHRTDGNECALLSGHQRCRLEARGEAPILEECDFKGTAAAADVDKFERRDLGHILCSDQYPD